MRAKSAGRSVAAVGCDALIITVYQLNLKLVTAVLKRVV
jgi:hypothetical protein